MNESNTAIAGEICVFHDECWALESSLLASLFRSENSGLGFRLEGAGHGYGIEQVRAVSLPLYNCCFRGSPSQIADASI